MSNAPIDTAAAHAHFSAACFNSAWDLIDKQVRTPEEDLTMVLRSLASMYHWTQRADCKDRQLSIGAWQASRVLALAGQAAAARWFGEICLAHSKDEPPFYLAYAHEALARAAKVAGDHESSGRHLAEARRLAATVQDAEERKMLEADLDRLA